EEEQRSEERQESEREQEPREIAEAAAGEGCRHGAPGVVDDGVEDPARGAAHLAVAREEAGAAGAVDVGHDDLDRDARRGCADSEDRLALRRAMMLKGVPEPEARDDEPDLLFGR